MNTQDLRITNRSGLRVAVRVDTPKNPTQLVFIAHGMGGFIGQTHIQAFSDVYLQNGYRVVRFDATHALGESEGNIEAVTYDSYIADLEDVIAWAKTQEWFQTPYALCGHSMGAQSTAWYAEHHTQEISSLAPMAPPINYKLYETRVDPEWKIKGYRKNTSRSKPGQVFRLNWSVVESIKPFDLLPDAHKLTMPVLDIVGEFDEPCPPGHQRQFMDATGNDNAKLIEIAGVEHSYRDAATGQYDTKLKQVKVELDNWIKALTA